MNDLWYGTSGPRDADIVLIGEAWGEQEATAERPFVGMSGRELTRMLAEAGIDRSRILLTNTVAKRPYNNDMWRFFHVRDAAGGLDEGERITNVRGLYPSTLVKRELFRLHKQITAFPRKLIITTGNYALWAVSDANEGYETTPADTEGRHVPGGIMYFRGSMLYANQITEQEGFISLLPIIHPAAIMRQWGNRAVTVHDLKARVSMALRGDWRPTPSPVFWAPPTHQQALDRLTLWITRAVNGIQIRLAADIETSRGHITCIGFADGPDFAMSIPFVRKRPDGAFDSYWSTSQEAQLIKLLRRLLSHANVLIEGQNFIYDTQYIQNWWGITPRLNFDTMLAHHLLWPGTTKGLFYLSSLYCRYHWFWKDDGKEWNTKGTLDDLLLYNAQDCIRTFECATVLREVIPKLGMSRQWEETMARNHLALRMMNRGVRINTKLRGEISLRLIEFLNKTYEQLERIIPQSWVDPMLKTTSKSRWYTSPTQQKLLFGDMLGMRIPKDRKTGRPSLGAEALNVMRQRYPEYSKLWSLLEDIRSVAVFQSHFIQAGLEPNARMMCSFNPAGTETFRWSSSKNAFGRGTNLQNVPSGDEE